MQQKEGITYSFPGAGMIYCPADFIISLVLRGFKSLLLHITQLAATLQ
jgi:hypothetical protein